MQSCLFEEENEKKEEVKSYKEKPTDEEKMVIEEEGLKRFRSRVQMGGGRRRLMFE